METDSKPVRYCVAEALGRIGAMAAPAVPELIWCLRQEEDVHLQISASEALGKIGIGAKDAIPHLAKLCGQESRFKSHMADIESAATALRRIGRHHREAIRGLYRLRDKHPGLFESVMRKCGVKAVPDLIADITEPVANLEKHVEDLRNLARSLNSQGLFTKQVEVEEECKALELKIHAWLAAKVTATNILRYFGEQAIEAIPVLDSILNDNAVPQSAWHNREAAAKALGAIGKKRPKLVEGILQNALNDQNECVRLAVGDALLRLQKGSHRHSKPSRATE